MRKIMTFTLAAAMLPVFGATLPEPQRAVPMQLPRTIDLSQSSTADRERLALDRRSVVIRSAAVMRSAASHCYYMRQVNRSLQKPRDKPVIVPLANVEAAPAINGNVDCLTDSLVKKAKAP